jgi:uncharacterized protein (DUF433 family)
MKFDAIESASNRLSGQPCIRGTRITVRRALQLVAQYPNRAELRIESLVTNIVIADLCPR